MSEREVWVLQREESDELSTLGTLTAPGERPWQTIEDPVRAKKIHGRTAIPAGIYRVRITWSPRFKQMMPLVENVPDFSGVRIHPGNTSEDTEGCILPGRARGTTGTPPRAAVFYSRAAYRDILTRLGHAEAKGREVWLDVRDAA